MSQYRRPTKEAQQRPHEFSRIIVCAALSASVASESDGKSILPYYRDTES